MGALIPAAISNTTAASRRRGFTLVEMLVVLLIMGLLVGLVSTITRPDSRALLRVEAERLAQLLDLAATESQLTGKPIAWTSNGNNYQFWQFQENSGWAVILDNDVLRKRTLPPGITVSNLQIESNMPQGLMRLEFTPYGRMLAFNIELSLGTERYSVIASPIGEMQILPGAGNAHDNVARY